MYFWKLTCTDVRFCESCSRDSEPAQVCALKPSFLENVHFQQHKKCLSLPCVHLYTQRQNNRAATYVHANRDLDLYKFCAHSIVAAYRPQRLSYCSPNLINDFPYERNQHALDEDMAEAHSDHCDSLLRCLMLWMPL